MTYGLQVFHLKLGLRDFFLRNRIICAAPIYTDQKLRSVLPRSIALEQTDVLLEVFLLAAGPEHEAMELAQKRVSILICPQGLIDNSSPVTNKATHSFSSFPSFSLFPSSSLCFVCVVRIVCVVLCCCRCLYVCVACLFVKKKNCETFVNKEEREEKSCTVEQLAISPIGVPKIKSLPCCSQFNIITFALWNSDSCLVFWFLWLEDRALFWCSFTFPLSFFPLYNWPFAWSPRCLLPLAIRIGSNKSLLFKSVILYCEYFLLRFLDCSG